MKTFTKTLATIATCCFLFAAVAQPSQDYTILIGDIEIQPGVTVDINVNVFVNENAQSWSNTGKIFAIEGMAHTAQCWRPLAEALFENTDPAMEINEFYAINLPGRGGSGLPQGDGFLFEDMYLEHNLIVYEAVLTYLNVVHGVFPRTIMGHSKGGLEVILLQDKLIKQGTNLKEQFGINSALLLAPAIPAPLYWGYIDGGGSQNLLPYAVYQPETGIILNLPYTLWPFLFFTNTCCYFPPNMVPGAPTPAEVLAKGYNSIEAGPVLFQLAGMTPPPPYPFRERPEANPGIFMAQHGVQLTIIADEFDRMMTPAEEIALYQYLTNDATLANLKIVLGEETCHDTHISDPHALAELITLTFNPVNNAGEYTILKDEFFSDALGHLELVDIWLPPQYFDLPGQHFPVVYFLHKAFSNESDYGYFLPTLNQMLANGEIDPFIIVKPNGWAPPYLGSCWYNSPLYGNYEDMVIQDLIPYIEENYRVLEGQDFRYHIGHSMGGHAGWSMSIRYPELFGAVADIAGYKNMAMTVPMLRPAFLAEQGGTPPYSYTPYAGQFSMLVFTTLGAYNANMANPPFFVNVFLDENGDIIPDYLDDYLSDDIIAMIPSKGQPPNTKYFIAQGFYDNVVPYPTITDFNQVLDDNGWEYEFFAWEGGHFDVLPALEEGFRFINGVWKEKQQSQTVYVQQGWSLISTYMMPVNPDVGNIFTEPVATGELIFALNRNGIFWPAFNINTMKNWFTKEALKVKAANNFDMGFYGTPWQDKTVELAAGINYLPVLSEEPVAAATILGPLGTDLVFAFDIGNALIYWPDGGLYTLENLIPGAGYLVSVKKANSVNFDNLEKSSHPVAKQRTNQPAAGNNSDIQHIIVIAPQALTDFSAGTVFTVNNMDGQTVASTTLTDRNLPAILVVNGDDPTTLQIDGLIAGEQMFISAISPESAESFALKATFDSGIGLEDIFAEWGISKVLNFKEATGITEQETFGQFTVVPNPVKNEATFTWQSRKPGIAMLTIHDLNGRKLQTICNIHFDAGRCQYIWNNIALEPGVFFCKLTNGEKTTITKLVIMK